jgi:hypothetical protein
MIVIVRTSKHSDKAVRPKMRAKMVCAHLSATMLGRPSTGCGRAMRCVCPSPVWPSAAQPHVKTLPAERKTEWSQPHAIWRTKRVRLFGL